MVIDIFWSLATKFGKGTCSMFLESLCQVQHMVIEGDQNFKIWSPMTENSSCWRCKNGFGHQIINDQKWVSIEILIIG
jgi:hypothetical protein